MDTLIIGRGYLGEKLKHSVEFGKAMVNPSTQRINSAKDVVNLIERYKPELIINAAGVTGFPNVDWCETHRAETYQGNVDLPINIATACVQKGVKMFHFGSGCIYEGDNGGKGYDELDPPNFRGSVYSRTKIAGEKALLDIADDKANPLYLLQARIRMPLDSSPSRKNLLTKLIKYASSGNPIVSTPNSMTIVDNIPYAITQLIEKGKTGVFNFTNPGAITHKELLDMYQEISGNKLNVNYVTAEEFAQSKNIIAQRSNCVLDTSRLERSVMLDGINFAARKCIEEYVRSEKTMAVAK